MRAFDVAKELSDLQSILTRVCQCRCQYDNERRPEIREAKRVILEAEEWEFKSRLGKLWLKVCEDMDYS